MTLCASSLKNILVLKKIIFLFNYFEFFLSKLIVLPWMIQIGPKSWICIWIQIQCIWIHNTDYNYPTPHTQHHTIEITHWISHTGYHTLDITHWISHIRHHTYNITHSISRTQHHTLDITHSTSRT